MLPTWRALGWRGWAELTVAVSVTACGAEKGLTEPGAVKFAAVSAGYAQTCGLTAAGDAYCWGPRLVPVPGGLRFVTLSVGGSHICGVTDTGVAYCWGYGVWGQLGNGGMFDASVPVLVLGQAAAPGPAPLRASTGARRLARSARRPLSLRPPSP